MRNVADSILHHSGVYKDGVARWLIWAARTCMHILLIKKCSAAKLVLNTTPYVWMHLHLTLLIIWPAPAFMLDNSKMYWGPGDQSTIDIRPMDPVMNWTAAHRAPARAPTRRRPIANDTPRYLSPSSHACPHRRVLSLSLSLSLSLCRRSITTHRPNRFTTTNNAIPTIY
jgi:hypothetical protein